MTVNRHWMGLTPRKHSSGGKEKLGRTTKMGERGLRRLTPRRHQSGEIDYDGGISKSGDAMLRTMLYEAAQSLLTHPGKWSLLTAWGMRVAQRRGMRRAIVAVARRLAVILHRMWVEGPEFRC